jgi:Domain of unknown function (DUF1707)
MAGPWHPMKAGMAGRGPLRASDADREQVINALKSAFVYGLLGRDDLYVRAGQVLASRTYAELTALTADIPAGLIAAQSRAITPGPSRRLVSKKVVAWAACLLVLGPAVGAAFLTFYGGFVVMFLFALIGATATATPRREGT